MKKPCKTQLGNNYSIIYWFTLVHILHYKINGIQQHRFHWHSFVGSIRNLRAESIFANSQILPKFAWRFCLTRRFKIIILKSATHRWAKGSAHTIMTHHHSPEIHYSNDDVTLCNYPNHSFDHCYASTVHSFKLHEWDAYFIEITNKRNSCTVRNHKNCWTYRVRLLNLALVKFFVFQGFTLLTMLLPMYCG